MKYRFPLFLFLLLLSAVVWSQPRTIEFSRVVVFYNYNGVTKALTVSPNETMEEPELEVTYGKNAEGIHMVKLRAREEVTLERAELIGSFDPMFVKKIFCNGYQCWTNSREFTFTEQQKPIRGMLKGAAKYYSDYTFYDYPSEPGRLHGWTYTYMRRSEGRIELLGSLNEHDGFTRISFNMETQRVNIHKDCEGVVIEAGGEYDALHLFHTVNADTTAFSDYAKEMNYAEPFHVSTAKPSQGWTSWYHYFTKIDEEIILNNLAAFEERKVPIDLFQIDDGWQESVGVWTKTNDKFPNGMRPIADKIHAAGYKAGIWLAPFICEKKSAIAKEHPDWLLKTEKDKPLVVGFNPGWSGKYYALDIYNPEVQAHVKASLDTIYNAWDFDMIKVDFLFGSCIVPQKGRSRGQVMADAIAMLRRWSGDKWILGCGVPLGSTMGQTDFCRIGSDIHMKWEYGFLKRMNMNERLSTWNSLTSTIGRRQLGEHFFYNDPDAFVLRSEANKLNEEEKHSTFLINNLFGQLILTSDNIGEYTPEQLELYLSGFPATEKKNVIVKKEGEFYRIRFMVGDREYLALINLGDKEQVVALDDRDAFDNQRLVMHQANSFIEIPAHGSRCYYLPKYPNKMPELLGGKGHLFSGSEMESMDARANVITLNYHPEAQNRPPVYILIPSQFPYALVNGENLEPETISGKRCVVYRPK